MRCMRPILRVALPCAALVLIGSAVPAGAAPQHLIARPAAPAAATASRDGAAPRAGVVATPAGRYIAARAGTVLPDRAVAAAAAAASTAPPSPAAGSSGAVTSSGAGPVPSAAVEAAADGPGSLAVALVKARASGSRVEATDLRTETTTTYANPDGTQHLETANLPVRVRQSGVWVPVDTTLVSDSAGVRPRSSVATTVLSGGGSGSLVRLTTAGKAVALGWLSALPVPVLSGDTATYAIAPATDLVVRATRTGFEQSVVLHQRPAAGSAPPVLRVPLSVSGLTPSLGADGTLVLADGTGAVVLTAAPPQLFGADTTPSGAPAHAASASTALVRTSSGAYELDVTAPAGFLDDPAVAYPVSLSSFLCRSVVGAGC